jgi:hypothetical protein
MNGRAPWGASDVKRSVLAAALSCAVLAVLASCAPTGGTEALADRVIDASDEFATILEQSADAETSDLDDGMLTPLGRDYRQLGSTGTMVAVPQGLLKSSLDGRQAAVTLVLATQEHTEEGLTYEHSNAFTCIELTGSFDHDPEVERRDIECTAEVLDAYLGSNHYSMDELNYK